MPALDAFAKEKLEVLERAEQRRTILSSERKQGVVMVRGGKKLISFCCNDYFGLAQHPKVIEESIQATQRYGTGAGASRLITGDHPLYEELEAKLAEIKKTEAACVFGSGYLANIGVIPALVEKGDLILTDKLIHACMIDGAQLSGADFFRFHHNNMEFLEELLKKYRANYKSCLILTETIFSMDGDRAPVEEILSLAKKYDAWVMSDDAHGLAITEPNPDVHIQMGTLSKGAASYGGYVCGSQDTIDYIKSKARSLIYSTALPPGVIAAGLASLEILQQEPERVAKPLNHATRFTELLGLLPAQSAIVPLIFEKESRAIEAAAKLAEESFLVWPIRPPTVPKGTARLRFTFSAMHTIEQVEQLADTIKREGWV